ncbi:hypothetical protein LAG90_15005 [Marinilongibacter aquaticus]|uniref:hypothetical protein n=1 Tax=Marinilongibacter aquaticus TaxID=2975157 RepID=UPI0021BDCDC9|nr:hypothetical protein [Marinilongibacter aquaticus]UBM58113.1 hypothetical protein LAG90_15005 [Marinilongibacter aquaticus]
MLSLLFCLCTSLLFGQRDLIVTQADQQIRCRIVDEGLTRITYFYIDDSGELKKSEIFKSLVKDFVFDHFESDLPKTKIPKAKGIEHEPPIEKREIETEANVSLHRKGKTKWIFGFDGGYGQIYNPDFRATDVYGVYQKRLMRGGVFGTHFTYLPLKWLGVGLTFSDFRSKNSAENLAYYNPLYDKTNTGNISELQSRKYLGVALVLRPKLSDWLCAVLKAGPGGLFYTDRGTFDKAQFRFKGAHWAAKGSLGFDFLLGSPVKPRNVLLGLEAAYTYGRLASMDFGDGQGDTRLTAPLVLDHLTFALGVRFTGIPQILR